MTMDYDEDLDRVGRQARWFFIALLLTMPLWYGFALLYKWYSIVTGNHRADA